MYIWQARSITSDATKAVFKLENPVVQNVDGIVEVVGVVTAEAGHNWPPLAHSHAILSSPLRSSTIIMMVRIAQITIMNGQRNLQTLIQTYDPLDRAMALTTATNATPSPIPP